MMVDNGIIRKRIPHIKVSYSFKVPYKDRYVVSSSETAYNVFCSFWCREKIELLEESRMLLLNRAGRVLGIYYVGQGGSTGCVIDCRHILSVALKCNAHGIVLAHNHPSSNPNPSHEDGKLTQKLKEACRTIGISFLDHLIITAETYYSFAYEDRL